MSQTTFESWFRTSYPQIPGPGAAAVLKLAAEGATVPFMARYRKEHTGNLDEVAIQRVLESKERWDRILRRQAAMLEAIDRQKKLTPELKEKILDTFDLDQLEDLYLPYKQKRKTKAMLAREAGLEPLADWIWNCGHGTDTPQPGQTLELWAFTFRNAEKGFPDAESAIRGAQDILTERLAETLELRQVVRVSAMQKGWLRSRKTDKAKPNSKYELYFDHPESVPSLLQPQSSHRYLAMRRGAAEEELSLSLEGAPDDPEFEARLLRAFEAAACTVSDSPGAAVLVQAARAALKAHVFPSIEAEVHRALKDVADEAAILVFAENVRKLLLASPFGAKGVLGIDPGVRTGCKLSVVDAAGSFVASEVLYLKTDEGQANAKRLLGELIQTSGIRAVAVGNGTAGREAELFVRAALREQGLEVPVVLVNEAGASVYSASDVAREEFPDLDVTVRGAISIARRLQDPLAELVKIDPRSIGVGQYQHDVPTGALKKSLEQVVDSCVNQVGVNLNTASHHLLAHVSGIGPALARAIVSHRAEKGLFRSREQLNDVPRFSRKTFEQAAGFLRVPGGEHPLDNTGVHPERYSVLEGLAAGLGKAVADLLGGGVELVRGALALKEELGAYTFDDVVKELEKPGRDPRDEFVPFAYREDVRELKDLKPGMVCPGIVTNVTNFGAFVDVGVHHDGLVHISQLSDRFVKDPREVVSPGDRVDVRVLEVNLDKGQISLTMKKPPAPRRERPREAKKPQRAERPPGEARPPIERRPPRPPAAKGGEPPRPSPSRPAAAKPARPRPTVPNAERPRGGGPPRPAGGAARPPSRPPERQPQRDAREGARGGKAQTPFNNPFASLASLKDKKQGS